MGCAVLHTSAQQHCLQTPKYSLQIANKEGHGWWFHGWPPLGFGCFNILYFLVAHWSSSKPSLESKVLKAVAVVHQTAPAAAQQR